MQESGGRREWGPGVRHSSAAEELHRGPPSPYLNRNVS